MMGIGSVAQKTPPEIQEFLNSPDYAWFLANSEFAGNGVVDLEQSFVEYEIYNNQKIPVISVNFVNGSIDDDRAIVGQIQVIKVRSDFNGLPGNSRYLQLYRDFRDFDFRTETGIIKVHDLNFEYQCTQATVNKGVITQLSQYQMPSEKTGRTAGGVPPGPGYHQCDLNQNGNVTFGECFSCLTASCAASPTCTALCLLMNLAVKNACVTSTVANCLIISVVY